MDREGGWPLRRMLSCVRARRESSRLLLGGRKERDKGRGAQGFARRLFATRLTWHFQYTLRTRPFLRFYRFRRISQTFAESVFAASRDFATTRFRRFSQGSSQEIRSSQFRKDSQFAVFAVRKFRSSQFADFTDFAGRKYHS